MSAPNAGRQSPPPESQSGAQQQDPPASGKIGGNAPRPASDFAQHESDEQKNQSLKSNPEHPLDKVEEAKFSKGTGN